MTDWLVKYDGTCYRCGTLLRTGEPAFWDNRNRRMSCIECPKTSAERPVQPITDGGEAGRSSRAIYERQRDRRHEAARERWGERLGGLVTRFAAEPQSMRAWGLGARGEELLGAALARVPDLIVLNDRGSRGTKANIDHIAIAPAGVFVIDAKLYSGFIDVVDKGSFFRSDLRLMIGGQNRSELTDKMGWQLKAVNKALLGARADPLPTVSAVLCFIDPNWRLIRRPKSFDGVRFESDKTIVPALMKPVILDANEIERLANVLATALPPR